MQPENAKIENFLDQQRRALDKLQFVAHEGENHSNRDHVIKREARRQVYRDDILEAKDGIVNGLETDLGTAKPHVRIHEVCITIEPLALAFVLTIEQFETLHRAQGFDEGRVFLRLALYDRFIALPEHTEESKPNHGIEHESEQRHESKSDAVYEHHDQRERRHDAVYDAEEQALGHHVADRLDRAKARKNVSDVPFLEEGHRQAHQVMKKPRSDLEAQRVLQNENDK